MHPNCCFKTFPSQFLLMNIPQISLWACKLSHRNSGNIRPWAAFHVCLRSALLQTSGAMKQCSQSTGLRSSSPDKPKQHEGFLPEELSHYLLYLPPRNPKKDQSPVGTGPDTYIGNFDAKESFPVVVENCQILKLLQLFPDIPCIFSQLMGLVNIWLDRKSTYSQLEEKRQAQVGTLKLSAASRDNSFLVCSLLHSKARFLCSWFHLPQTNFTSV